MCDKQDINNYRPIRTLAVLSIALEKGETEQLVQHLDAEVMLHPMLFGFNHSTETAFCLLLESIKLNLQKEED